jgi:hypothetical protein
MCIIYRCTLCTDMYFAGFYDLKLFLNSQNLRLAFVSVPWILINNYLERLNFVAKYYWFIHYWNF